MKLNREQLATVLTVIILMIGAREILLGVFAPTGKVLPVDPEISRSRREVVPRMYRKFKARGDLARDPFVFSEGWQPLTVLPMTVPFLPPAPRPAPTPLQGAPELDAGVRFVETTGAAARSTGRGARSEAEKTTQEGG